MQEGSPPDPAAVSAEGEPAPTPAEEPSDSELEGAVSTERTPEQIEAIWRNRVAGKDRAHAAEAATLRQQIADYEARLAQRTQQENAEMSEAEREKARADAAEQQLAAERQARVLDVRKVKYAAAAEHLDEPTLAAMDEAKLASLNARLTDDGEGTPPPPVMDPSSAPRRSAAPPTSAKEKSVEELEADLRKYEPEFEASLNQ